mmetsp:Transcript_37245/g.57772  ORF Transcript_37245/g.57772 Transcript_37245/m.57772 type:complete len:140 (+) Transcript_37245:146-565(+)
MAGVGCILIPFFCDKWGRRSGLLLASIMFILGILMCITTSIFWIFLIGRIVIGLGIGMVLIGAPLLLSEITPSKKRGSVVTFAELANCLGILLGFIVGYVMYLNNQNWRLMIGIGIIPPCINILFLIFYIPESPRWLIG